MLAFVKRYYNLNLAFTFLYLRYSSVLNGYLIVDLIITKRGVFLLCRKHKDAYPSFVEQP